MPAPNASSRNDKSYQPEKTTEGVEEMSQEPKPEKRELDEKLPSIVLFVILPLLLVVAGLFWLFLTPSPRTLHIDNMQAPLAAYTIERYNALFAAFAFVGVITAIILQSLELRLQRKELEQTREELKGQKEMLARQAETMSRERFEQTLVNLTSALLASVERTRFQGELPDESGEMETVVFEGGDAFGYFTGRICHTQKYSHHDFRSTLDLFKTMPTGQMGQFAQPLMVLSEILMFIEHHFGEIESQISFNSRDRYLSQIFCQLSPAFILYIFIYTKGLKSRSVKYLSERQAVLLATHNVYRFVYHVPNTPVEFVRKALEEAELDQRQSTEWLSFNRKLEVGATP